MLLQFFLVGASTLIGSTLSKIIAKVLVFQKGITFFSQDSVRNIPFLTQELSFGKTFDILEPLLFILISLTIFSLLYFLYKNKKYSEVEEILIGLTYLVSAFIFYISISFASYSGSQTLVFLVLWFSLITAFFLKLPIKLLSWQDGKNALINGFFTGFYLLILLHNLTTSIALPLILFASLPLFFYLSSHKFSFLGNPGFIFLLLAFIFPFNKSVLLTLGLGVVIFIFVTRNKAFPKLSLLFEKLSPFLILFIFLYNPLFYLGTYDSIEEGFWAGWLQRLLDGQIIYKDFAAYHPPLLLWGLSFFTKIIGVSLYTIRLYFHLLQIIGFFGLYLVLRELVKSTWIRLCIFLLILAYGSTLVRNNMEIRLATGILPLFFVYFYKLKNKKFLLIIAGALSGLSLFISLETGMASLIALVVTTIFSSSRKNILLNFGRTIFGVALIVLPLLAALALTGSLAKFIEYLLFYPSTFSQGFQNIIIDKPTPSTLIQWREVNQFFTSIGFIWELIKFSLLGTLCLVLVKKFRKTFESQEILVLGIIILGIVLSRSALGRSDEYHLLFVWLISLLLIGYILQFASNFTRIIPALVLIVLIFFIGNKYTQGYLLQNQLFKFQSYANLAGSYPSYQTPRAKITTGIDSGPKITDDLVDYIDEQVTKNETIFVFPQSPEIHFLADRKNATSFDTPTAFFTNYYQEKVVEELEENKPALIIYNPDFAVAGISVNHLAIVNTYILENFSEDAVFGKTIVLKPI